MLLGRNSQKWTKNIGRTTPKQHLPPEASPIKSTLPKIVGQKPLRKVVPCSEALDARKQQNRKTDSISPYQTAKLEEGGVTGRLGKRKRSNLLTPNLPSLTRQLAVQCPARPCHGTRERERARKREREREKRKEETKPETPNSMTK